MSEFHTRGQLAKLVLCNRGHDCKAKLRILIEGIDVIVLEEYADTHIQKLSCVLQRVESVTCKSGDLLGDDEVEHILLGIADHSVEILSLLGGDARDALVDVARDESPAAYLFDFILIVCNLVGKGVQLLVGLLGNTGVKSNPQGNIVNALGFQ